MRPEATGITAERWQQIKTIVAEALDQTSAVARAAFVAERCSGDAELRAEVESLLDQPTTGLENFARKAGTPLRQDRRCLETGRRIGPWSIIREVGRGGMGTVYLAERADGAFEKRVAIKLLKRGVDTDEILRRFQAERQILARLDHPNITSLIDAGTADDELPYVVMDYVVGEPITRYASKRQLSIPERLKLFRSVCSAVSYAHQNLVVHRDLKPSNILVTESGEARLLDFGIAKLLSETEAGSIDVTVTALRAMTPEYASPEQVRGEAITTLSDVYSLGVCLYELLTGTRPYKLTRKTPDELRRAICEQEPPRPSTNLDKGDGHSETEVRKSKPLKGDLDNIVLMALRKEPVRRYTSVEQFSEDIRRHLNGLPVRARKSTYSYRGSKFIARHKLGLALTILLILTLCGGIVTTTIQARNARRRFNEVRKLAHSLLFDYHDAIASLPGSTSIRQRLVNDALHYLDNLSREMGSDPALLEEVADAYEKVAAVQGGVALLAGRGTFLSTSNLGDAPGALRNLDKAHAIWERLMALQPKNEHLRQKLAYNYLTIGFVHVLNGPPDKAVEFLRQAIPLMEALVAAHPSDDDAQYKLWNAELGLAKSLGSPAVPNLGDWNGAMEIMKKSGPLIEQLAAKHPENLNYQQGLGALHNAFGQMFAGAGDNERALENYTKALRIDQTITAAEPGNALYRRELAIQFGNVGNCLLSLKNSDAALENFKQALVIHESMAIADPSDSVALRNTGIGHRNIGSARVVSDPAAALSEFQKALDIFSQLAAKDPSNADFRRQQAHTFFLMSQVQNEQGQHSLAVATAEAGIHVAAPLLETSPNNASARTILAQLYVQTGVARAANAPKVAPEKEHAEWLAAKEAYLKARAVYQEMKSKGTLQGADTAKLDELAREIAKCDAALK